MRGLRDYLAVLRRHPWIVLLGGIAGLGIAAYQVFTAVPHYRAAAVIRLTTEPRRTLTGGLESPAAEEVLGAGTDRILSHIQIVESRSVLAPVIRAEGLQVRVEPASALPWPLLDSLRVSDPVADSLRVRFSATGFSVAWDQGSTTAPYGRVVEVPGLRFIVRSRPPGEHARLLVSSEQGALDAIRDNLRARPRERTNIVDLEYVNEDPYRAQDVVNRVAETFQGLSATSEQQQARRRRTFVEAQLRQTDSLLVDAQLALSAFRQREQIFSTRDRLATQQSALIGLEMRREELAADRAMLISLLDRVDGSAPDADALATVIASPGVAANPVIKELFAELTRYRTALDTLTTGPWALAATHPDVERLHALIGSTRRELVGSLRSHVATLEARISALDGLRARSATELADLPHIEAEEARIAQRVEAVREMANLLRNELQRARIAEAVEAGQVEIVDQAALPVGPIPTARRRILILGLMVGLFLGGGGALLIENLNTSIRRKEEIEDILRVPGLAVVPSIGRRRGPLDRLPLLSFGGNGKGRNGKSEVGTLVTADEASSPSAEAYRTLRTNLIFSRAAEALTTVVVTSPSAEEGKTTTAANLAVTFAQQGMKVLMLDCDLRRARLHRLFEQPQEPGLVNLLLDSTDQSLAIRATDVEGLYIAPSGPLPPNPAELLGGPRMRALLEKLRGEFDLIVIDSPPVLAAADASILAVAADAVLVVVRAGQTKRVAAQETMQQLSTVGARVLGAVLNDPDAEIPGDGSYYPYAYSGQGA